MIVVLSWTAFEFMDNEAMKSVTKNLKFKNPIGEFPFYVLVETSGSNGDHDAQVGSTNITVILKDAYWSCIHNIPKVSIKADIVSHKYDWCISFPFCGIEIGSFSRRRDGVWDCLWWYHDNGNC